jgi:exodeoxyribonuclease V alpha subunit
MVDTILMHHLLKAVPMTAILILVGDVFQLPPIGPGNVLSDLIDSLSEKDPIPHDSATAPVFTLTRIFRQARESLIVQNAHRIRVGKFPKLDQLTDPDGEHEFYFFEANTPDMAQKMILRLCRDELPQRFLLDPISDIQVLTPMHKGKAGTIALNQTLQHALNPTGKAVKTPYGEFRCGDKVMHLKNNYQKEVFNGDMGIVIEAEEAGGRIEVDYDGRIVGYEADDLDEISLGYAITVHKSQGSEYPAVVIPMMTAHFPLLQRNLLYTAVTRGKNLVILVGMEKAVCLALENDRPQNRTTLLKERLDRARKMLRGNLE